MYQKRINLLQYTKLDVFDAPGRSFCFFYPPHTEQEDIKLCIDMYKLRWNDPIVDTSQNLLDKLKECFDDSETIADAIRGWK